MRLDFIFSASIFDIQVFDLIQVVEFSFRVFYPIFEGHSSKTRVGLIKNGMIFHVELIDEGRRTDGFFFGVGLISFQFLIELALF